MPCGLTANEQGGGRHGEGVPASDLDQQYLLPPSLRDWLPADHLAFFVSDLVDPLDLAAILCEHGKDDPPNDRGLANRFRVIIRL
jgi:hypothetical protein